MNLNFFFNSSIHFTILCFLYYQFSKLFPFFRRFLSGFRFFSLVVSNVLLPLRQGKDVLSICKFFVCVCVGAYEHMCVSVHIPQCNVVSFINLVSFFWLFWSGRWVTMISNIRFVYHLIAIFTFFFTDTLTRFLRFTFSINLNWIFSFSSSFILFGKYRYELRPGIHYST